MHIPDRTSLVLLLAAIPLCCDAAEPPDCFQQEVEAHVLQQFATYGPLSTDREYFGFIFRIDGVIASSIARGARCAWREKCEVDTGRAGAEIPAGAKVLGEWHTHPHATGSRLLSSADVRGANRNRHIRCYRAYFSTPGGDIISWDPGASAVSVAMSSSVRMGSYRNSRGG